RGRGGGGGPGARPRSGPGAGLRPPRGPGQRAGGRGGGVRWSGLLRRALPLAGLAFPGALPLLPTRAVARPGGGQSYSGGGSSGGGGGGGGDGGGCAGLLIQLWIEFVFAHPLIGIPLTIVILVLIVKYKGNKGEQHWDSGPSPARLPPRPAAG